MLAQPEHLLSFKLMGIEPLTSGDVQTAAELLQAQRWLDLNSRDVLDESDKVLDVKFQLIYTLGSQQMMDGQPDRWLITQGIFDLVKSNIAVLENQLAGDTEVKYHSSSGFPHIQLHSPEVGKALIQRLTQDVIHNKLPSLQFDDFAKSTKNALLCFLQDPGVSSENCVVIMESFGSKEHFMQKLLLLRGLLAFGIVLFCLRSKRWSVNYGLHLSRCLVAVPYRAKGVPASSAEFGHPDVAVALTCFSYYYAGLTDVQIR